jgi:hypothetical protein
VLAVNEWETWTIAAAFVAGTILGTIATIRMIRVISNHLKDTDREHKENTK